VWLRVFHQQGCLQLLPSAAASLAGWWPEAEAMTTPKRRRATNSIILLTLRSLWLERNARVFDGVASTATSLANRIIDEWRSWMSSRALGRGGSARGIG
jgi:hypothetical protein